MTAYQTEKTRFIGETPTHIPKEKLLDYFLYTFEFMWSSSVFEFKKENIKTFFKEQLDQLKVHQKADFTPGQEWWSLVLLALKQIAGSEAHAYSQNTIQLVLDRVTTLTDVELEDYANAINMTFYYVMPEVLSIRPLEMDKLSSDAKQNDEVLAYFLDRKDEILEVFTSTLVQEDIDVQYMNNLAVLDKNITEPFTSFWNTYYEVFIGFSISMYILAIENESKENRSKEALVKELTLVFLIASVTNSRKIEKLNERLCELLLPLYLNPLN